MRGFNKKRSFLFFVVVGGGFSGFLCPTYIYVHIVLFSVRINKTKKQRMGNAKRYITKAKRENNK